MDVWGRAQELERELASVIGDPESDAGAGLCRDLHSHSTMTTAPIVTLHADHRESHGGIVELDVSNPTFSRTEMLFLGVNLTFLGPAQRL